MKNCLGVRLEPDSSLSREGLTGAQGGEHGGKFTNLKAGGQLQGVEKGLPCVAYWNSMFGKSDHMAFTGYLFKKIPRKSLLVPPLIKSKLPTQHSKGRTTSVKGPLRSSQGPPAGRLGDGSACPQPETTAAPGRSSGGRLPLGEQVACGSEQSSPVGWASRCPVGILAPRRLLLEALSCQRSEQGSCAAEGHWTPVTFPNEAGVRSRTAWPGGVSATVDAVLGVSLLPLPRSLHAPGAPAPLLREDELLWWLLLPLPPPWPP